MSTHAISDHATMLRRNLRHALRYPGMTLSVIGMPVVMLLLFVYILGGALGDGIAGSGMTGYVNYLAPGIILMTINSGITPTAVAVRSDMNEGIVARFRTMAIARSSVLVGHVVSGVLQGLVSTALVVVIAMLVGFRPSAGLREWAAVAGLALLLSLSMTWLAVALGLWSKTVEGASNVVLPLIFLPFVGSGFVPPDSMSSGVRWFADHQPFTPMIETFRGLLTGTPIGNQGIIAVAWMLGLALFGYLWARALFRRDPS